MTPRRYSMSKKQEAAAATRRRILDATLKLHGQRGIFGTSWKDIATEADVAVGTVYKYFPTIDALVPACGELLMERVKPPSPDSIAEILLGASTPAERLLNVAKVMFDFYERGGRHLEADLRERELPAVKEWEDYLRDMVLGFARIALAGIGASEQAIAQVVFLFDLPTYRSMRIRGQSLNDAAQLAVVLALARLAMEKQQ